jgi:hypothetical protein
MKYYVFVIINFLFIGASQANPIPSSPSIGGTDRFIYDGTRVQCETAITSSAYLQMGVYGEKGIDDGWNNGDSGYYQNEYNQDDFGVYAAIVVPIGSSAERVDCSKFVDIARERQQMELERAKLEHEAEVSALKAEILRLQKSNKTFKFN